VLRVRRVRVVERIDFVEPEQHLAQFVREDRERR